ncbi:single-stranded DNA-binding protein [Sulfobacillus thermosulfidooxidans]|uniref:single-stranded DNA-binding protein n=1 Tax=Sulfobacillus thermosulfidooxidans TaxID=28034 RepID=UPI0006B5CAB6|nr:single-stranded DNA-binding protein [Sulfobacillus thermosulfidooxidans]
MMNHIILIGRLTRDPEMRYTPQGTPVAAFTLAVDRPFTNAQGQRDTDFIDCVVWRKLAETVGNYLQKGRLVAVEGRLQVRSYEAQDGTKRRVAEVVAESVQFLDSRKDAAGVSADAASADDAALPDDLPF